MFNVIFFATINQLKGDQGIRQGNHQLRDINGSIESWKIFRMSNFMTYFLIILFEKSMRQLNSHFKGGWWIPKIEQLPVMPAVVDAAYLFNEPGITLFIDLKNDWNFNNLFRIGLGLHFFVLTNVGLGKY